MSRRTNSGSSTPTTPARALHCSKCEPPAEKADCFCKDCKKYFCSECESFFHRSSSRQHHNRVKVSEDVHKHTREADVRSKAALGSSGAALDAEGDVPTTKRSSNDDFARVLVPATTSATDSGSDLKVSVEEALSLLQDFVNSRVAWPDWEVSLPGVLRVLSGAGSEELFAGFQKADGVHKVVSTARLIFDESRLLEHICLTFRILSRNQEAHDMMGLSVIGLLLQALQRHSVDVRIVEHSCGTLSNLGGNPEYVDDIARNNGVTLVQRALLKHDEDARASTMALHALANFGANPALRRDVARASLPHVAAALNTHSMDIQLVEHATRLLVNAIGDQEALKTITTQENIYQPAISAAMTTHGGASAAVASHCEILLALWQPPAPGIVSSVTANVAWAFGLPINIPKSAWSKFRKNKGDSDSKGAKKSNKSRRRSKGNEEALRTGV